MVDANLSEVRRNAARARWRGQVASRAALVAAERIGELPDAEAVRLAHAAAEEIERRQLVSRAEAKR